VHEEVRIPKSLEGVGDTTSFVATVNGNPKYRKNLAVDPYSSQEDLTLHYLINKPNILSLASKVSPDTSGMTFTLAPATGENAQTTTEMLTDQGNVNVQANWEPNPLDAGTESTVVLTFSDGFSGQKITGDVGYNLRIRDNNGSEVYSKSDLVAKGGTGTQAIDFPRNENYHVEVEVTGITEGQSVDQTRNGVARGTVVVPEFPAGAILAMAGIVGAVLVLQRLARKAPSV
jgi:hypothetical protein